MVVESDIAFWFLAVIVGSGVEKLTRLFDSIFVGGLRFGSTPGRGTNLPFLPIL